MMAIINSVISRSSLLHLRGNLVLNYPSPKRTDEADDRVVKRESAFVLP